MNQINKEIARILDLPDVKERLESIAFVAAPGTPDEYHKIVPAQIQTLHKLVSDADLRPK